MSDEAVTLSTERVVALAAVSQTYQCALVDDETLIEQADGKYDLAQTKLPDGRFMYEFNPESPPKEAADDGDGKLVLELMHEISGSLWFKTRDDFELFALEVEGVSVEDGKALLYTDGLFTTGRLAPDYFETVVKAD